MLARLSLLDLLGEQIFDSALFNFSQHLLQLHMSAHEVEHSAEWISFDEILEVCCAAQIYIIDKERCNATFNSNRRAKFRVEH